MKDRMKNYQLAPMLLMVMAFNHSLGCEAISRKEFMEATFKDRVEMLKITFERNLIDCRTSLEARLENKIYSGEQEEWVKEMINILKAIEAACNKKKGKKANNSVLFHCFLHNDSNPSMSWSAEQHGFYCFSCNKGSNKVFDLFDFLVLTQRLDGPEGFKKAFQIAVMIMVEDGDKIKNPFIEKGIGKHTSYIPYSKEMNRVRHWTFHYPIENDKPALKKLEERGISLETAKRMAVMTWYPTIDNQPYGLCYWVFINDDGSYTRRLATMNKDIYPKQFNKPFKWWNPKNKSMGIFNTRVLEHCRQFQEVCFVTESAIDAMSCEELGYHAVGLNSINNLGKFFTEYVDNYPNTMLICLTDNDEAGKGAVVEFQKRKLFIPDNEDWLKNGLKDINDALVANKDLALKIMKNLEIAAKEFYRGIENE